MDIDEEYGAIDEDIDINDAGQVLFTQDGPFESQQIVCVTVFAVCLTCQLSFGCWKCMLFEWALLSNLEAIPFLF